MRPTAHASIPAGSAPAALPARIALRRVGDELLLERRWLSRGAIALVAAGQVATVGLLLLVAQGRGGPALRWGLFVALVVGSYLALAVALNRTRLRAGAGRLVVSHGPFPCPGWGPWGRTFPRAALQQFTVRADPGRGYAELGIRLSSGAERALMRFADPHLALEIEAQLRERVSAAGVPGPLHRERGLGLLVAATYLSGILALLHGFVAL